MVKNNTKPFSSRNNARLGPATGQPHSTGPLLPDLTKYHDTISSSNILKTRAQRFALLHLLAVAPASLQDIARKTHIPADICIPLLEKIADSSPDTNTWRLSNKYFKELDVWNFPYATPTDRQAAIDNAVHAFDRQRISPEDKLWQSLLPADQRGKGRTLSKLDLANTPILSGSKFEPPNKSALTPDHRSLFAGIGNDHLQRASSLGATTPQHSKKLSQKELTTKKLLSRREYTPFTPTTKPTQKPKKEDTSTRARKMAPAGSSLKRKAEPKSAEYVTMSGDEDVDETPASQTGASAPSAKRVKTTNGPSTPQLTATSFVKPAVTPQSKSKAKKPACTDDELSFSDASSFPTKSHNPHSVDNPLKKSPRDKGKPVPRPPRKAKKETVDDKVLASKPAASVTALKPQPAARRLSNSSAAPIGSTEAFFDNLRRNSNSQSSTSPPVLKPKVVMTRKLVQTTTKRPIDAQPDTSVKKRRLDVLPQKAVGGKSTSLVSEEAITSSSESQSGSFRNPPSSATTPEPHKVTGGKSKTNGNTAKDNSLVKTTSNSSSAKTASSAATSSSAVISSSTLISNHSLTSNRPLASKPSVMNNPASTSKSDRAVIKSVEMQSSKSTSSASSASSLPPSLVKPSPQLKEMSLEALEKRASAAYSDYVWDRAKAEMRNDEGLAVSDEMRDNLWHKHRVASFLGREFEERAGRTLMTTLSKDSAAYFEAKSARLIETYTTLREAAMSKDEELTADEKEHIHELYDAIMQIQQLCVESKEQQRATQAQLLSNDGTGSASPAGFSRRQTLDLYKRFYQAMAAYKDFLHHLRTDASYPDIAKEDLEKDDKMFDRLAEMRRDLMQGINAIISKSTEQPAGRVAVVDGPLIMRRDADGYANTLKWNAIEWQARYNKCLDQLGVTTPAEMTTLFDDLDRLMDRKYELLRADALDYGDKETADLGSLDLASFKPADYLPKTEAK